MCLYICISGLPIEIFYRNYLCADPMQLTFSAPGYQCQQRNLCTYSSWLCSFTFSLRCRWSKFLLIDTHCSYSFKSFLE